MSYSASDRGPRLRTRAAGVALCLALSAGAFSASAAPPVKAPAKAKGKKPAAGPKNAMLSNALNEKGAQVQQCAIDNALEKGASKVEINVRVTINRTGAVVDSHITAKVDGNDHDKVRECVENVVQTAKFPAVATPLATSERSWTISSQ